MEYILPVVLASFWVAQLIVSFILFKKLTVQINKRDDDAKLRAREEKLFKLYQNLEEMMDTFEEYVNTARQEITLERRELTELSRQAAAMFHQARDRMQTDAAKPVAAGAAESGAPQPDTIKPPALTAASSLGKPVKTEAAPAMAEEGAPDNEKTADPAGEGYESKLTQRDREAVRRFSTKPQKVRHLIACGLTVDEIAKELDIGIGEVKLISDLDK